MTFPCDEAFRHSQNDIRVTVHDRATSPLIEDNGHMVEPNTATDIAINRVSMFYVLCNFLMKYISKPTVCH